MKKLFDVTIWDGSRLIGTATNIVATDEKIAAVAGIRAIASRPGWSEQIYTLKALYDHLTKPSLHPDAPEGIRVYAAEKGRGVLVVG